MLFTAFYVLLAAVLYVVGIRFQKAQENLYRVSAARLLADFEAQPDLPAEMTENILEQLAPKKEDAQHIVSVWYLPADETDTETVQRFYSLHVSSQMLVAPVFHNQAVCGYLRINYIQQSALPFFLKTAQIFLVLIYLVSMALFVYIDWMIIKPFHTLSDMPYELSRGNLTVDVKDNHNRYFGRFVWGIGMLRDTLDSQRRRELKLARDKKMLLLTISHDIKTPLNAILLYAKALEEGLYDTADERRAVVAKIQEKAGEINRFVKDIVRSQTEEAVDIQVADSEYYLSDLVLKVQAAYQEKSRLHQCLFQIGTYENCLLKGDFDRIFEAVGNLIENAFKYGDGRELKLLFTQEEGCQLIHVYNSGMPVEMLQMPHLFESFFRGTNATGKEGNGLGLYICSEVMKKMQGDIYAVRHERGMEFVLVCKISSVHPVN